MYERYERDGRISKEDLKRYNRLKKIDKRTAEIFATLYKNNDKLINSTLKEIAKTTRKETINNMLYEGVHTISKKFDVDKVVNAEVAGRTWKERTKHYEYNFTYDMRSVIRDGLEQGHTYTQMCQNLKKKIGKNVKKPMQIARTESHRVVEFTKNETMQEIADKVQNVEVHKIWRTMQDERVRSSHKKMEGQEVKFDELFTLPSGATCLFPTESGDADEDINCRCYVEYVIRDKE